MQNTQDIKATIFHAMLPSEPEPSVTYTFRTEGGGSMELKFPLLFTQLGDDFERWFREEKHVLLRNFHDEYRKDLMDKGNYYAKLIHDAFTTAWVHEQYLSSPIKVWTQS